MSTAHHPRSVEEVADIVRATAATGAALRVRAAGTWMDVGLPVRATGTLDLSALRGVHVYTPDDLTISVGAATTIAELEETTHAHGQWCPLLPWGDDTGTVGATVATATTGPFADALGRPRDLVIGLECVDGTGRIIRAGGRVVKNVAGFDLTRLMTGQWGTLGVITALHLRLRARPVVDETFALSCGTESNVALLAFTRGPYAPLACVPLARVPLAAARVPDGARWLIRVGGNRTLVDAAYARLSALGATERVDHEVWHVVRRGAAPAARANLWRWDALSQRMKERFDPARVLNRGLLGDPS